MRDWTKALLRATLLRSFVLYRGSSQGARVCLTFDDGPNPNFTEKTAAVLESVGAKGTFFCVGDHLKRHPALAARLQQGGHEVANHSMSHRDFRELDLHEYEEELNAVFRLRYPDMPASISRCFRPPKGALSLKLLLYCKFHRIPLILWSKDPKDFREGTAEDILRYFRSNPIRAGDIVLLHDKTAATLAALPELLDQISKDGLAAVTVSEMIGTDGRRAIAGAQ